MELHSAARVLLAGVLVVSAGCDDSDSGFDFSTSKVFKYSGYVQCQPQTRQPLEEMILELTGAGIDVLCSQTGGDGIAYATLCGAESGEINVYSIRSVNLEDAEALGFASVMTLPEYEDTVCE